VRLAGVMLTAAVVAAIVAGENVGIEGQGGPLMLDPSLAVRTVTTGLNLPTSMVFLGTHDILVLEKETGHVKRVVEGSVTETVLDLGVNRSSERGLLGIALHPDFPANPGAYLYWTCRSTAPPVDPAFPDERTCLDTNMFLPDSGDLQEVPLLGNRVDRFVWDGASLTYERNLIQVRAYQADAGQPVRGNHDGGVITFGPDGKLYIIIGDVGRRGWMQNLPCGPTPECPGPTVADDQFGGPEPDDAHMTGVILRLNDDGSTPEDNPFFGVGAEMGGEAGANIQKIFAYGIRNSFGMAFDPRSGALWTQENGDDTFTEINRVRAGFNGGWVQIAGPVGRIADYKRIETTMFGGTLQQLRWPPTLIADTPEEAVSRLFVLPGSRFTNPKFSWKFEVAAAGIGFLNSRALGQEFAGDLFAGAGRTTLAGGYLFRFNLNRARTRIAVSDERLRDRVADNIDKFDITESESLLIGRNFGIGPDIETGPNGNLFVVSLSNGAIYEIYRPSLWASGKAR